MKKYKVKLDSKKIKGFSLIELMVVVVLISLIVLGLVTFFTGGARSWIAGQSQLKAQREARQAMDRMVREIREGEEVTSSTKNSITVNIPDFDNLDEAPIPITYSWSGTPGDSVYRESIELIKNVKKLEFDSDVSKINIILEVDVDDDDNPDITLDTDVNLRNYGL